MKTDVVSLLRVPTVFTDVHREQFLVSLKHIIARRFAALMREGDDMICTDGFIIRHTCVGNAGKKRILPPRILFVNSISQ